MTGQTVTWLRRLGPARPDHIATLLLLPHAGGSAHVFSSWVSHLPRGLLPLGVEYPGHGTRGREPLPADVADVVLPLAGSVPDGPVIVLGHSLGAIIGFELAWRLQQDGRPPIAFVASGARPPHLYAGDVGLPKASNRDELAAELHRRGQVPDELLHDLELRDLLLPVLMSDVAMGERYRFGTRPRQLDCHVTVLAGADDPSVPAADLHHWQAVATQPIDLHVFPGGHFYFAGRLPEVMRLLAADLALGQR